MIYTALLIPADILEPIQEVEFNTNAPESWPELIGLDDNEIGFLTYAHHGVQYMHDDISLLRDHSDVNLRMNLLDAKLVKGGGIRLTNMLEGDFLLVGVDAAGETMDVPQHIKDLAHEAHKDGVVLDRQVSEAQVKLKAAGAI